MNFEPGWAILAGLIGGAAMAMILYAGILMMPRQMKMNVFMLLGSMMLPVGPAALFVGGMMHAGLSVVFGLAHGAVFSAAGIGSAYAAWGLLFGLVHWAIAGTMLGLMPLMHLRIRYEGRRLVAAAAGNPHPEQLLDPPGFFALNYPPLTAVGFLMLHLVFGVVVGALYGVWAG